MGNAPDRSLGSNLFIQLESQSFRAGTPMRGAVHMELKNTYLTEELNLTFFGYEKLNQKKHFILSTTVTLQ